MNKEISEILVRTGVGTRMGNVMRRYWVPILASSEIEPDGPQVRVKILGEALLAFRDTDGRPGLIDEFCSHRGASLFFGRNEENGIRCGYHGLKFDHNGKCVEVPCAPQLCSQMNLKSYPCIERGGIVWAYMGPEGKQPDPVGLEWATLPSSHVFVSRRWQQCNYLQAMEGGIDTAHVSYVHRYEVDTDPMHMGTKALDYIKADGNVVFDIEKIPSGLALFGRRNGEADSYYWRVTQWIFPWFTLIPPFGDHPLGGHAFIPMDDENCWVWSVNFRPDQPLSAQELHDLQSGRGVHAVCEEGTFRPVANKDNDYLVDRKAQREKRSYSGVFGFAIQDASLQESMGPIQNREAEHLLPTDKPIAMARRMLHEAALGLEQGNEPPALQGATQCVRAAGVLLDRSVSPLEWAQEHLTDSLEKPLYSV